MTFTIVGSPPRLESDAKLTAADFDAIARRLGVTPFRARKTGFVAARRAKDGEVVETHSNGRETVNTARTGDWVVTNLSAAQRALRDADGRENTYVVLAARFADLYEKDQGASEFGDIYRAKGVVSALELPGGFDIIAPWGERQTGAAGFVLLNGDEVYGASAQAFRETYAAA